MMTQTNSHQNYGKNFFSEAAASWKLVALYQSIEEISPQPLSILEKAILRGLLSGYSPKQIIAVCHRNSEKLIINLVWQLYNYIERLDDGLSQPIQNYEDIPLKLAKLGYKKTDCTILLQNSVKTRTENMFRGKHSNAISSENSINTIKTELANTYNGGKNTNGIHSNQNTTIDLAPSQKEFVRDEAERDRTALVNQPQDNNYLVSENSSEVVVAEDATAIVPAQNYELPWVNADDFMPAISRWTRLGSLFIVGSVGIAIALSALTPYKVTVKGNAKIRPTGKVKVIQAATAGTITSIKVKENQQVTEGDIIATIDDSQLETEKSKLQTKIQQFQLQLQQMSAQIATVNRQITAETSRIDESVIEAEAELARTQRNHQNLQTTTSAEVAEAKANLHSSHEELKRSLAEFNSAQANLASQNLTLKAAQSKYNRYQTISTSGALSQDRLEETKLELERQQQQVVAQQATVNSYQSTIARQEQAIAAAQARLENVTASLNPSNADITIASKKIAQIRHSGTASLANLNRDRQSLIQNQIEMQKQLERDQRQLQQLDKNLDSTNIKASATGTLFQLNIRNLGQIVEPSTEIAQIAPDKTSLLAQTFVSSQDISHVKPENPVDLRISACPYPDYGTLKGEVIRVSPDTMPTNNSQNQQPLYEVTVRPESNILSQGNNKCSLQLGMEGTANIISKEETVLQFLLREARLTVNM